MASYVGQVWSDHTWPFLDPFNEIPRWELVCSWVVQLKDLDWLSSALTKICTPKSLTTPSSIPWPLHPRLRKKFVKPSRIPQAQPLWVSPLIFQHVSFTYSLKIFPVLVIWCSTLMWCRRFTPRQNNQTSKVLRITPLNFYFHLSSFMHRTELEVAFKCEQVTDWTTRMQRII